MIKSIGNHHLPELVNLLQVGDLSADDIFSANWFSVIGQFQGNQIIAAGGLENFRDEVLLRSVVTALDHRGQGFAEKLVRQLHRRASIASFQDSWLLTTTASDYFANKFGYSVIERTTAPLPIKNSGQFSQLCPDSAVLMRKSLN